ncbi:hypothetical protein JVT61DRAFT_15524 [Boletus reticuloceps]|uniref:Uncharacterized protein n=1 Tax=Boletus reticuloceps TaxID=495285 RepID=A0A8I2YCD1_9AGAM|nr:hypothetical protein JVT61DRAFT_15524 [Boletus reticuloceps]
MSTEMVPEGQDQAETTNSVTDQVVADQDENMDKTVLDVEVDATNAKAKGKGKAKAKAKGKGKGDAEANKAKAKGENSLPQKYTSAVEMVETKEVQEMLERIDSEIRGATLGYALMTVMDEDDMGREPKMERQMVNLCNIDDSFMRSFIKGVEENGLRNKIVENALDVGIVKVDVNLDSLQPMKTGLYTNRVKWQEEATESTSVLYNGNHRFTYMRYQSGARKVYMQREKAKEELRKNPPSGDMISGLKTVIADAETAIIRDGVWLVRFLDLGKQHEIDWRILARDCANDIFAQADCPCSI